MTRKTPSQADDTLLFVTVAAALALAAEYNNQPKGQRRTDREDDAMLDALNRAQDAAFAMKPKTLEGVLAYMRFAVEAADARGRTVAATLKPVVAALETILYCRPDKAVP